MNNTEEWKDIPGFEGLYQASTKGNIRSLDMMVRYKNTSYFATRKGRVLLPKTTNTGYLEVVLMKNKIRHCKRVHSLIAITFIPNPNGYNTINHINENKKDNSVNNLEWCTPKYNIDVYHRKRTTIYQYDLFGNSIKVWHSISNAAKEVDGDKTGVQHCCKGAIKTYKNYIWSYFPLSSAEINQRLINNVLVKVEQLDSTGKTIASFNSIKEAAKAVGCNPSAISMACSGIRKTIKGYIWRKKV